MKQLASCFAAAGFTISLAFALAAHSQELRRTSAGVPDFSGIFSASVIAPTKAPDPFANGDVAMLTLQSRDSTLFAFEADAAIRERGEEEKPQYRPEHWNKVRELDLNGNARDPSFSCLPQGIFRLGPPQKIVQTATEMIFLYPANGNVFRVVSTDNRPENEFLAQEQSYWGYSRGRWEGDKLVIETTAFNGNVWLGWPGYFTSTDLRVVEEMWWQDGKLMWQPTAHDPVLMEPYKAHARAQVRHEKADADLLIDVPCDDRALEMFEAIGSKTRG
jgi:hypothetical protein